MVYGHCLVSEQKTIPFVTWYEHRDGIQPCSKSKAAVSKSIREEAAEVFWSTNVFQLSSGPGFKPKGNRLGNPTPTQCVPSAQASTLEDLQPQNSDTISKNTLNHTVRDAASMPVPISSMHDERSPTMTADYGISKPPAASEDGTSIAWKPTYTNAYYPEEGCHYAIPQPAGAMPQKTGAATTKSSLGLSFAILVQRRKRKQTLCLQRTGSRPVHWEPR
ncbi:MAG: hypothetical protein Q9161_004926 [Pseudevernia consocians]